jgi:hypothetical protein
MTVAKVYADDLSESLRTLVDQSALFSSVGFARIWEAVGGRPVYWVVDGEDGTEAVLCGVEFGRGLLRRFQSMPDGCYGSFFRTGKQAADSVVSAALLEIIVHQGYARTYVYDYYGSFSATPGFDVVTCSTSLVDISSPNWQPPDKTLQSEIRKAEREGVGIIPFDADLHLDAFMRLMIHTDRRHGRRPRYPLEFYRRLARLAHTDGRVLWRVVEHEGELAASHIYFIDRDLVLNWQVCFDKRFSFLKPNQYLLASTARLAASRGIRVLNLGASPEDAETLAAYKKKWGGEEYTYCCLQRRSWLGTLL